MAAECGRGWADRCKTATGKKCVCRCGGRNHGIAFGPKLELEDKGERVKKMWGQPDPFGEALMQFKPKPRTDGIILTRTEQGKCIVDIDVRWAYHSPDGYEWGYGGSGPADLALNILKEFVDAGTAWRLHHDFKFEFLATMPKEGGEITREAILTWLIDNGVTTK